MSPRILQLGLAVVIWVPVAVVVACSGDKDGDGTTPPDDELVVEDLGPATLSDTGGYIDLSVEVPDGAVSTMVYCGGWGDSALGAVWSLTDPSGSQVYSGDAPDAGRFRSDFLDDLAPALVPMSPQLDLSPGTWGFQWFVGAGNDGSASCGAVHRVDTVSDAATVHVDLVFVGVDGLDAATAPEDAAFQEVLAELEAEWGSANLTPSYSYVDFSGDVARYAVVDVADDDYTEFNDLLRTSSPDGLRTVTFFLVQEIANSSAGGATILGLAGGPPGAAAVHGTSKSGVIVSAIDYAAAPTDVGKIMAHEGGHFLGLFHTTEKDGSRQDILNDTPVCPLSADSNADGTLNSSECGGQGAENVMWWTLNDSDPTLSSDQSWVLRRSPVAD